MMAIEDPVTFVVSIATLRLASPPLDFQVYGMQILNMPQAAASSPPN